MLEIGRHLNARWDAAHADELVDAAGLDRDPRVGTLSGGQRTRLALALVLARRPQVLLLDEPLADLDPLARLEVQQTLMTEVVDTGMTVLMSSHILGEIAELCEDLLVMVSGSITLSGVIDTVLAQHRVLVGPGVDAEGLGFLPEGSMVEVQRAARQTTVLVDRPVGPLPIGWSASDPTLEEIVVAYLRRGGRRGDR
jgi:ABC-2 type transport system ATP-binding protein